MTERSLPFLPVAEPDLGSLEERYLLEAFRSGWISSIGEFIGRFEQAFASFCGVEHAVAVSNGTAALHMALLAAGVGPGDEVIVPALTFVATASAVRYCGATPVFVESEPEIGTISPKATARAITARTKAIVPVHLYGHPADMDPILDMAANGKLVVIEDAAEAHGALYKGKRVGGIGHMGAFSFYGNKILTTGEGGMVVTGDASLASRIQFLKDHAMDPRRRYWHPEIGYNYRMTNLQAAIGCAQLERYEEMCRKRREVLAGYRKVFSAESDIVFNPAKPWAEPVNWLVCALLPKGTAREERDRLMTMLREEGIDSRPYLELVSRMPPYSSCASVGTAGPGTPVAEDLSARGMNLPSALWLGEREVQRISETVGRWRY